MNIRYNCEKDILVFRLLKDNWQLTMSRLQHHVTCVGSCIVHSDIVFIDPIELYSISTINKYFTIGCVTFRSPRIWTDNRISVTFSGDVRALCCKTVWVSPHKCKWVWTYDLTFLVFLLFKTSVWLTILHSSFGTICNSQCNPSCIWLNILWTDKMSSWWRNTASNLEGFARQSYEQLCGFPVLVASYGPEVLKLWFADPLGIRKIFQRFRGK
jgi:hypothetical protein